MSYVSEPSAAEETLESPAVPVVDAFLLETILEKDLANIVEKSRRGVALSARERVLIEGKLSRLKEGDAPADFVLEPEGPAAAMERMTQKDLAEAWGVSVRTIKGWTAAGIGAADPVPLARPRDFPAWFQRIHAPRVCPERYRLAAQKLEDGEQVEKAAPVVAARERLVIPDENKGLLAMLERHREAEAQLGTDYMEAVERGDEVRASFLLSQWSSMGEKLRQLEKLAPRALEELGIYVRKEDVARELEPLHRAILKTFQQELRKCRPKLRATQTAEEWNLISDEIVGGVASMLTETEFRDPLTLEGAA